VVIAKSKEQAQCGALMGNDIEQSIGNCRLHGFTGILRPYVREGSAPHKSESLCLEKPFMPLDAVPKSQSTEQMTTLGK
jgi:hypothetical protein